MIGTALAYSPQKSLEKIIFVLYGQAAYRIFKEELARQKGK
jgi:hypothetical protein